MRHTKGVTYVPKEIRETYIILIGFWASYLFGNILYLSTSDAPLLIFYILGGMFLVFIGMNIAATFDAKAAPTGSLGHYGIALFTWFIICLALFCMYHLLSFKDGSTWFGAAHIWIACWLYFCRIVATELCRTFKAI